MIYPLCGGQDFEAQTVTAVKICRMSLSGLRQPWKKKPGSDYTPPAWAHLRRQCAKMTHSSAGFMKSCFESHSVSRSYDRMESQRRIRCCFARFDSFCNKIPLKLRISRHLYSISCPCPTVSIIWPILLHVNSDLLENTTTTT